MSPVFRHGRLRLYLLKLLDEAPRHGYEVIRLLQDRFLGVYAPSPGTIYPRLARLEEDGLVTHDEEDGRKVYRITEKGREEIRARLDDLAELEEELADSVRDIAREVSQDVRDTVRSLREELTWATRDIRRDGEDRRRSPGASEDEPDGGPASAGQPGGPRPGDPEDEDARAQEEARRIRDQARRARAEMREVFRSQRQPGGRPGWQDWAGKADWPGWQEWAEKADWASWQEWASRLRGGRGGGADMPGGNDPGLAGEGAPGGTDSGGTDSGGTDSGGTDSGGTDTGQQAAGGRRESRRRPPWGAGGPPFGDLERLAIDFAQELRSAAGYAGNIGDAAMGDLRDILTDTLARIRSEIFGGQKAGQASDQAAPGSAGGTSKSTTRAAYAAGGPADAAGRAAAARQSSAGASQASGAAQAPGSAAEGAGAADQGTPEPGPPADP
ncbi:MAG: helix-turn-helix transcriptional regulator [Streptosporangiaceae bacterium]